MSEIKICPACRTPQQWEAWRYCGCGHDFGPSAWYPTVHRIPPEERPAEARTPLFEHTRFTKEAGRRYDWYLLIAAWIVMLVTRPFPALQPIFAGAVCVIAFSGLISTLFYFLRKL